MAPFRCVDCDCFRVVCSAIVALFLAIIIAIETVSVLCLVEVLQHAERSEWCDCAGWNIGCTIIAIITGVGLMFTVIAFNINMAFLCRQRNYTTSTI